MKTLEQQLSELTAEHNFKSEMQNILGNTPHLAYASSYKESDFTVTVKLLQYAFPDLIESCIKEIIEHLPVTNKVTLLGNDNTISYSPLRLDYQNNIDDNHILVSYYSNRIHVRIEIPIIFYQSITKRGVRNVSDCEHHYFGGVSMKNIKEMKLVKYSCIYFDEINWYGGDVSVICKSDEYTEQFNEMVLTGTYI